MRLPKDILSGTYIKPRLFLCETDKTKITQLNDYNRSGTFKLNSYSELSFEIGRTYVDDLTGETKVNPFYDKLEALRLIYMEDFGHFEIQEPEITGDGIQESKSITAYSQEYTLSQRYLSSFFVNTGEIDSREVIYADANGTSVEPVVLYNPLNPKLSLMHLILEKAYGWRIGHIDDSIKNVSRTFEVDRESVYDFIINEVCPKYNCYAVFDTDTTGDNIINLYAEALTSKFIGDGATRSFVISKPYATLETVSVDGYKTTAWTYDPSTGIITFDKAPADNAWIEVVDGSQAKWETDVFVSFDNLSQEVNISYSADEIKTVLTVTGADDLDIREVNLGQPYIVDLSYYHSKDWMGEDLYNAYNEYLKECNKHQVSYANNAHEILELNNQIAFETERWSLQYSVASVTSLTQGKYYVRGGEAPNYYYTEVSLPSEYNAANTYYNLDGVDLNEDKTDKLYKALQHYYQENDLSELNKLNEVDEVTNRIPFDFMEYTTVKLSEDLTKAQDDSARKLYIDLFLDEMWQQYGKDALLNEKEEAEKRRTYHVEKGWANENDYNRGYIVDLLFLDSIARAIDARQAIIDACTEKKRPFEDANSEIGEATELYNFFKTNYENSDILLKRLSAFLREDEYTDDSFFYSDTDELTDIFKIKQELLECGRIELNKLCQPKLKFSMNMANIYALPEFEPIMDQFQLGKLIKIEIRKGYVRRSRLMQVDINFEDFSDFSCEFGELTSLISQSDIHADLLSQAVQAGKSVASNASYWNKGTETSTKLDLQIQQGLLDAATAIKSIDGTQHTFIDKYGIHLQKKDPTTGEIDDKQGWIVNNQFLYSDDAFKTTKSVFGEYKVGGQNYWGLLAEAVIAGYIEGSQIKGGEISSSNYSPGESGTYFNLIDGDFDIAGGKFIYNKNINALTLDGVNIVWDNTNEPAISNVSGLADSLNNISKSISEVSEAASNAASDAEKNSKDYTDKKDKSLNDSLTDAYKKYADSKVSTLDEAVAGYLGVGGKTIIGGSYVISPYIAGGYLNITNNSNSAKVIIDPNNLTGNNYIFQVHNGKTVSIGIDKNGNASFSGTVNATGGKFTGEITATKLTINSGASISGLKTSQLSNDSDYQNTTGVVSIAKGAITADYIKTLNLQVGNQISMGPNAKIEWSNVNNTPDVATKSYVTGQGYQNQSQVSTLATQITKDTITSTYIKGLNLEVGNQISMGPNAKISWNNVTNTPDVATKSYVTGQGYQTSTQVDAIVTGKGYQTYTQVTEITRNTISTENIYATNLKVKAANIDGTITASQINATGLKVDAANITGKLTATQIDVTNLQASSISADKITSGANSSTITFNGPFTATSATITGTITADYLTANSGGQIAGWTIDDNSIRTGTLGSSGSMWLCRNGTSTSANIGGSGSRSGWCIGIGSNFGVTNAGYLYAIDADISGGIYANYGRIGNMTIKNGGLRAGIGGGKEVTINSDGVSIYYSTSSDAYTSVTWEQIVKACS